MQTGVIGGGPFHAIFAMNRSPSGRLLGSAGTGRWCHEARVLLCGAVVLLATIHPDAVSRPVGAVFVDDSLSLEHFSALQQAGPPELQPNVVLLSSGYTVSQKELFAYDAARLWATVLHVAEQKKDVSVLATEVERSTRGRGTPPPPPSAGSEPQPAVGTPLDPTIARAFSTYEYPEPMTHPLVRFAPFCNVYRVFVSSVDEGASDGGAADGGDAGTLPGGSASGRKNVNALHCSLNAFAAEFEDSLSCDPDLVEVYANTAPANRAGNMQNTLVIVLVNTRPQGSGLPVYAAGAHAGKRLVFISSGYFGVYRVTGFAPTVDFALGAVGTEAARGWGDGTAERRALAAVLHATGHGWFGLADEHSDEGSDANTLLRQTDESNLGAATTLQLPDGGAGEAVPNCFDADSPTATGLPWASLLFAQRSAPRELLSVMRDESYLRLDDSPKGPCGGSAGLLRPTGNCIMRESSSLRVTGLPPPTLLGGTPAVLLPFAATTALPAAREGRRSLCLVCMARATLRFLSDLVDRRSVKAPTPNTVEDVAPTLWPRCPLPKDIIVVSIMEDVHLFVNRFLTADRGFAVHWGVLPAGLPDSTGGLTVAENVTTLSIPAVRLLELSKRSAVTVVVSIRDLRTSKMMDPAVFKGLAPSDVALLADRPIETSTGATPSSPTDAPPLPPLFHRLKLPSAKLLYAAAVPRTLFQVQIVDDPATFPGWTRRVCRNPELFAPTALGQASAAYRSFCAAEEECTVNVTSYRLQGEKAVLPLDAGATSALVILFVYFGVGTLVCIRDACAGRASMHQNQRYIHLTFTVPPLTVIVVWGIVFVGGVLTFLAFGAVFAMLRLYVVMRVMTPTAVLIICAVAALWFTLAAVSLRSVALRHDTGLVATAGLLFTVGVVVTMLLSYSDLLIYVLEQSSYTLSSVQADQTRDRWRQQVKTSPGAVCTLQREVRCTGWLYGCATAGAEGTIDCPANCNMTSPPVLDAQGGVVPIERLPACYLMLRPTFRQHLQLVQWSLGICTAVAFAYTLPVLLTSMVYSRLRVRASVMRGERVSDEALEAKRRAQELCDESLIELKREEAHRRAVDEEYEARLAWLHRDAQSRTKETSSAHQDTDGAAMPFLDRATESPPRRSSSPAHAVVPVDSPMVPDRSPNRPREGRLESGGLRHRIGKSTASVLMRRVLLSLPVHDTSRSTPSSDDTDDEHQAQRLTAGATALLTPPSVQPPRLPKHAATRSHHASNPTQLPFFATPFWRSAPASGSNLLARGAKEPAELFPEAAGASWDSRSPEAAIVGVSPLDLQRSYSRF